MIPIDNQVKGQGHVGLPHFVQWIIQEHYTQETSNLVGRF